MSTQFRDFANVLLFSKILSLKSIYHSWGNLYRMIFNFTIRHRLKCWKTNWYQNVAEFQNIMSRKVWKNFLLHSIFFYLFSKFVPNTSFLDLLKTSENLQVERKGGLVANRLIMIKVSKNRPIFVLILFWKRSLI